LWQQAKQEMEVVKRQAVVYSMYARPQKNIMVSAACKARCYAGWHVAVEQPRIDGCSTNPARLCPAGASCAANRQRLMLRRGPSLVYYCLCIFHVATQHAACNPSVNQHLHAPVGAHRRFCET
jgi:hypothetical protein